MAPAFAASADFAITKPAHTPCPNLQPDFRCGIHAELRQRGFAGCTAYDCFGAGQRLSQVTFGGRDWRSAPGTARQMYAAFPVMRDLHELLWLLEEAARLGADGPLGGTIEGLATEVGAAAGLPADALEGVATGALRVRVGEVLRRVSSDVRGRGGAQLADLLGADLRGARLEGADLSSALFVTRTQLGGARVDERTGLPRRAEPRSTP